MALKQSVAVFVAFFLFVIGFIFYSSGIARAADKNNGGDKLETQDVKQEHGKYHARVCTAANAEDVGCHARVVTDQKGNPMTYVGPVGLGPKEFHAAYASATTTAGKMIIGIVDAYDHQDIYNDLTAYSTALGIPVLPQCVGPVAQSSIPCFQKVDQSGGTNYPQRSNGWALEIALDVEVAHAMCQNCSIVLVEATSNGYPDLMASIDRAILSGAKVVSNSWGSGEVPAEIKPFFESHFNRSGIAITFSSGDGGYGATFPAASRYVTAVGGTTLTLDANGAYADETAWAGTGSGCSAYERKPAWQHDTGCKNRTVADISAVADPNTGAAIYDSLLNPGGTRWFQIGGTSLSSPIIAGMYALSGKTGTTKVPANQIPYLNTAALHDVTSGSNGSCGGSYLCTALLGYDGPTGLGTPNGLLAF